MIIQTLGIQLGLIALIHSTSIPPSETRHVRSLDSNWRFHLLAESAIPSKDIVGTWRWKPLSDKTNVETSTLEQLLRDQPSNDWKSAKSGDDVFGGRVGFALFETTLTKQNKAKLLHFTSVDDNATVYFNGKRILHHDGWNDPFDVPLDGSRFDAPITVDVVVENENGPGGIGAVSFANPDQLQSATESSLGFDDSRWRVVQVPHDFVIEGKFNESVDSNHASLPRGKAWYRKSVTIPTSARRKSIWVDFEGAFADARVWWNGHYLGEHRSGYTGFRFDLSKFAHPGGKNEIAVLLDATKTEGWWYEGGGIYRHVWLTITDPVHIDPLGGVYVTSDVSHPRSANPTANIKIQASLEEPSRSTVKVSEAVVRPNGTVAAKVMGLITPGTKTVTFHIDDRSASLWSLEKPQLYTVTTSLYVGSKKVDQVSTPFGVRTIRFDKDRGFLLNERPVKLKGTCNHQDFAGVGIAMPDTVLEWRIKKLQSIGSNAYRCSHNEVAPELLDICDRLGMLVMDENREFGDSRSGKATEHTTTNDLSDLRQEVLRDRNHPSVIMWSLCNEEFSVQTTSAGGRIASVLGALVRQLDPTRPFTAALNGGHGHSMSAALDLEGFNYGPWEYPPYHQKHPNQPLFASETASTVTTRGEYEDDKKRGMVQAYDRDGSDTAENAWQPVAEETYNAGAFVWTGFDYKGEPSPYNWPNISSNFGILDSCGFPKDNAYYYMAWWGSKPVVHIEPHWNWRGSEGKPINVWVFGNGDSVELFLNGQSLGAKPMPKYRHIEWSVPYSAGTLEAKSYANGKVIATDQVRTAGPAAALRVTTVHTQLTANNEDCEMLEVAIVDAQGTVVPDATNLVSFKSHGTIRVVGVGNGDPTSHEPDRASQRHAFHGLCLGVVQTTDAAGKAEVTVTAPGLKSVTVHLSVTGR